MLRAAPIDNGIAKKESREFRFTGLQYKGGKKT